MQIDPRLCEVLAEGQNDDEVPLILRLHDRTRLPSGVRVVAEFGDIVTCRVRRDAILRTHADANVASAKARQPMLPELEVLLPGELEPPFEAVLEADTHRPDAPETGKGVVVGMIDWGLDFAHPDFRHENGATRLLALWDQRRQSDAAANRYGYGRIFDADAINRALQTSDPYGALGYHPADFDMGRGAHGTHTTGIACGNGRAGGPLGVAPEADLVFVQFASVEEGLREHLGDSVALLEGLDFILKTAGSQACAVNLSMGNQSGEHDGLTPVEQAFDYAITARPNLAIVHSVGNYFNRSAHSADRLRPGEQHTLTFTADTAFLLAHEIDIWYSGRDRITAALVTPAGEISLSVPTGERTTLTQDDKVIARIYNRRHDPNNGDNQISVFLHPDAPIGTWQITLEAEDVVDGRFHAWIEREARQAKPQPRFQEEDVAVTATTNTICNGFRTLAVGAYNSHTPGRDLAPFSSSGPTRDGRQKPDMVAPGVNVLAARSAPRETDVPDENRSLLTRMSGTSMAAPHVTGTCALLFETANRPLTNEELRNLLLPSAEHSDDTTSDRRLGSGYLNIDAALDATRRLAGADPKATGAGETGTVRLSQEEVMSQAEQTTPTANIEAEAMPGENLQPAPIGEDILLAETGPTELDAQAEGALVDSVEAETLDYNMLPAPAVEGAVGNDGQNVLDELQYLVQEAVRISEWEVIWQEVDAFGFGAHSREGDMEISETPPPALYQETEPGETAWSEDVATDSWEPEDGEMAVCGEDEQLLEPYRRLTVIADAVLNDGMTEPASFLPELLSRAGAGEALMPFGRDGSVSLEQLFDAYVEPHRPGLRRYLDHFFEPIATPGTFLNAYALQPADIVLWRARSEGQGSRVAVLATGHTVPLAELGGANLTPEVRREGWYVQVIDAGSRPHSSQNAFARRLSDNAGRIGDNMMILRLRPSVLHLPAGSTAAEDASAPAPLPASLLTWSGATSEQLAFMRDVYDRQVNHSREHRTFVGDIPASDLLAVEAGHSLRSAAALSCRSLLAAARNALDQQQRDGQAAARAVASIGVLSGYRPASQQFANWQRAFPQYYEQTRDRRAGLSGGEHGSAAGAVLANYIGSRLAAPGFSLHNDGLAVDFTTRDGSSTLTASTGAASLSAWRRSWLFQWLSANAASYGFVQNTHIDEPWHWEYQNNATSARARETAGLYTESVSIPEGRLELRNTPLLSRHRGTQPDLILHWNNLSGTDVTRVDVVVHLHGHSSKGANMSLPGDKEPVSGLDFHDPNGPSSGVGRTRPTLAILPRGDANGGEGYDFPALETGLQPLIDYSLTEFARAVGLSTVQRDRLIVTAHSGGGKSLMPIVVANDPDEVHVYDALYWDPKNLIAWARRRIAADQASGSQSALRVLFLDGTDTANNSRAVHRALCDALPDDSVFQARYRVAITSRGHKTMPRVYGWRLLEDAGADLPNTTRLTCPRRRSASASSRSESAEDNGAGARTQPVRRAAPGMAGTQSGVGRYVVYQNEVRVGGSLAWRHNNPGNIRSGTFATGQGAIGRAQNFAIFPDEQTGMSAISALLRQPGYQALTVRAAVFQYAPPEDHNDSEAYVRLVQRRTGLDPARLMSSLSNDELQAVINAIRVQEGWQPGTIYTCGAADTPAWAQTLLGCGTTSEWAEHWDAEGTEDGVKGPVPPTQPAAAGRTRVIPIVFVPGIMGSRLHFTGINQSWNPDSKWDMLHWVSVGSEDMRKELHFAQPAQVMRDNPDAGLTPAEVSRGWGGVAFAFYGPFLRFLHTQGAGGLLSTVRCPVYAVGYDWRQSSHDSGNTIAARVRAISDEEGADCVLMVTHSMGGIATRAAIKQNSWLDDHLLGVIHAMQPVDGAAVAYRRYFTGTLPLDATFGLTRILGNNPAKYATITSGMRGPAELLPTNAYRDTAGTPWLVQSSPLPTIPIPRITPITGNVFDLYRLGTSPPKIMDQPAYRASRGRMNTSRLGDAAVIDAEIGARIREAQDFHEGPAGLRHFKHDNTWAIYGTGLQTDTAIVFASLTPPPDLDSPYPGATMIRRTEPGEGDGTVPMSSGAALFPGQNFPPTSVAYNHRQYEVRNVEHGTAYVEPTGVVRSLVVDILKAVLAHAAKNDYVCRESPILIAGSSSVSAV